MCDCTFSGVVMKMLMVDMEDELAAPSQPSQPLEFTQSFLLCFTICLFAIFSRDMFHDMFVSPDLDGCRAPKGTGMFHDMFRGIHSRYVSRYVCSLVRTLDTLAFNDTPH